MAILLPPPPRQGASLLQWEQWWETLWRRVRPATQLVSGAAATIGTGSTYVGVTPAVGGTTLTLPVASSLQDGDEIIVQDEAGDAGAKNITIASAGSDTINGAASVVISGNYGRKVLIKRGAGTFFSA